MLARASGGFLRLAYNLLIVGRNSPRPLGASTNRPLSTFLDQGFTALALQLSQVINQDRAHRSQNTSARKLKKLPEGDLRKLVGKLCEGKGRHDQLIAAWLVAGIATWLRPCEWQFARLGGDTLMVKNAKATNGRAHGSARRLHLDTLTPEQKNIIAAFISRIQDFADFEQLQKQRGDRLFRVTRCLWPKRQQHITSLYIPRATTLPPIPNVQNSRGSRLRHSWDTEPTTQHPSLWAPNCRQASTDASGQSVRYGQCG
jgi:hypothetical protein